MKKGFFLKKAAALLSACLSAVLSSCSSSAPSPEGEWTLSFIQSNTDGTVVAASPAYREAYPNAEEKEMTCLFDSESFTLADADGGKSGSGTYEPMDSGADASVYTLLFSDGENARAVSSYTETADGERQATLILSTDEYTLHFAR